MNDKIKVVSDASFEADVVNSSQPVLVDFWAEWCGPCKALAPILDEIADEYDGKITIAKVNVDENVQLPPKYGIRGIPTMLLFKDGAVQASKVGALSKANLKEFITCLKTALKPVCPVMSLKNFRHKLWFVTGKGFDKTRSGSFSCWVKAWC